MGYWCCRLSIRCRLYHPKPRLWRDRWLFFPEFFSDPYSNFAARRQHLQQQRQQQQQQQQQPLPKGMGIKRRRRSLETLHAALLKRLPRHDKELCSLLQEAAAAEEGRRLLLPLEKQKHHQPHPSSQVSPSSSNGEETPDEGDTRPPSLIL